MEASGPDGTALPLTSTSIELVSGRIAVVKRRLTIGDAGSVEELVEREARWLIAAHHPGVVTVRRVSAGQGSIATDHVGLLTLRTARLSPTSTALVLGHVAAILGDLHRRGLVHANLTLDHVLLRRVDPPVAVLCSPAVSDGGGAPDVDLAALAELAERSLHLGSERWRQRGLRPGRRAERWAAVTEGLRGAERPIRARAAAAQLGALARWEARGDRAFRRWSGPG